MEALDRLERLKPRKRLTWAAALCEPWMVRLLIALAPLLTRLVQLATELVKLLGK